MNRFIVKPNMSVKQIIDKKELSKLLAAGKMEPGKWMTESEFLSDRISLNSAYNNMMGMIQCQKCVMDMEAVK